MPTQKKNKGSRRKLTPSEISELYSGIGRRDQAGNIVVAGKSIAFATQTERKAAHTERVISFEQNGRIRWVAW